MNQSQTPDILPPDAGPTTFVIDTTQGSWLHRLVKTHRSTLRIYLTTVLLTYAPLLLSVRLGPAALLTKSFDILVPFMRDWNVHVIVFISFPTLVVFTLRDQAILAAALRRVQLDGVLMVRPVTADRLSAVWQKKFKVINYIAYAIGVVSGSIVVYYNYVAYVRSDAGFWTTIYGKLQPCGYVFFALVFALFALIPIYSIRSFATSMFLRSLVKHSEQLQMLPFHPDRCGGLRPVGRLGLRNQYLLTVFGLNIGSLVAVSSYLRHQEVLHDLIGAATIAYVVLGPIIFMGPLLSFRSAMLQTKLELMSEVAQRLRVELKKLRQHLPSGPILKEDEDLIDRLRKVGGVVDELPVWPFDAGTLRKFVTAYVMPLFGGLAAAILKVYATPLTQYLKLHLFP